MGTSGVTVKGTGSTVTLVGSAGDDAFAGSVLGEECLTGLGDDHVYGGGGNDRIYADIGDDWLHGGSGMDTLDFEFVNNLDSVTRDATPVGVTFDLTKKVHDLGFLGTKTIYSFESVWGTGNSDKLYGDGNGNELAGLGGNDALNGRGGNDSLQGVAGKDVLTGGTGADALAGNVIGVLIDDNAKDVFRFKAVGESGVTSATRDTIWGSFNGGGTGGDKIDLGGIDANGSASGDGAFSFIGSTAFHSNSTSEVRVTSAGTNLYLVQVDIDLDSGAEMTMLVHSNTALVKGDFVL